mgnify:CR=1 FL=1
MKQLIDERRVQTYNTEFPTKAAGPVVYVMAREQRIDDNWAFLYACQRAAAREVGVIVLFVVGPMFNNGSARHNEWMVASLKEVATACKKATIPFQVLTGTWASTVCAFAEEHDLSELVFDFNPLEPVRTWRDDVIKKVSIPVVVVDARNIIPCWLASQKTEFAAHTFRPKVHRLLPEFSTAYPKRPTLPRSTITFPAIDWETVRQYRQCDYTEPLPDTYTPGRKAGLQQLHVFLNERLAGYASRRNDPTQAGVSDLSPYLRWGNISSQAVARAVKETAGRKEDKDAFLEELIVRRELTDNYVYYTEGYDTFSGAHAWAQKTLEEHRADEREYVYTYETFRDAKTHDDLWNAMQTQMVTEGKMHGWCRMYWAKKILEWTASPEDAIEIALTLNDYYELDGRDSNGVVGVMWSICGVHDRAWTERPVFGKIRYMNYNGAKRKFPVAEYIDR